MDKEIIPAIMPETFEAIRDHVVLVRHHTAMVQLDLMDGVYVPESTWPFREERHSLDQLLSEQESFPLWDEVNYELDLMIDRPERDLDTWLRIGASRVIFHYASVADWNILLDLDPELRSFVDIGLALTIHDPLEKVYELLDTGAFDYVQVMGISRVGYQGEPFEPKALDIIAAIHAKYPDLPIGVDGGVSRDTIRDLDQAGASSFVSGSGVFSKGIPSENIQELYEQISE